MVYRAIIIVLLWSGIIHAGHTSRSFVSSIEEFFGEKILQALSVESKDISKECTKLILPLFIAAHNRMATKYCIEYGCEAAWAWHYKGIKSVPAAMIKYACIDACYWYLCKAADCFSITIPEPLEKNKWSSHGIHFFGPFFIKRILGTLIESYINCFFDKDDSDQNDLQTLENYDFYFSMSETLRFF